MLMDPVDVAAGVLDDNTFEPFTAKSLRVAGADLLALRVSYAGEYGWELHHCPSQSRMLLQSLLEVGGPLGLHPAGMFALLNSLRLEKGFMHYGADVSLAETPLES